jgi:hypothetical protein
MAALRFALLLIIEFLKTAFWAKDFWGGVLKTIFLVLLVCLAIASTAELTVSIPKQLEWRTQVRWVIVGVVAIAWLTGAGVAAWMKLRRSIVRLEPEQAPGSDKCWIKICNYGWGTASVVVYLVQAATDDGAVVVCESDIHFPVVIAKVEVSKEIPRSVPLVRFYEAEPWKIAVMLPRDEIDYHADTIVLLKQNSGVWIKASAQDDSIGTVASLWFHVVNEGHGEARWEASSPPFRRLAKS